MTLTQIQLFSYVVIGFMFGIGFTIATTLLAVIDRLLAMLILKNRLETIIKPKGKNKPPEGLNFGSKT